MLLILPVQKFVHLIFTVQANSETLSLAKLLQTTIFSKINKWQIFLDMWSNITLSLIDTVKGLSALIPQCL